MIKSIPIDSGLVGKGIAEIRTHCLKEHPQELTYHLPAWFGLKRFKSGAVLS